MINICTLLWMLDHTMWVPEGIIPLWHYKVTTIIKNDSYFGKPSVHTNYIDQIKREWQENMRLTLNLLRRREK